MLLLVTMVRYRESGHLLTCHNNCVKCQLSGSCGTCIECELPVIQVIAELGSFLHNMKNLITCFTGLDGCRSTILLHYHMHALYRHLIHYCRGHGHGIIIDNYNQSVLITMYIHTHALTDHWSDVILATRQCKITNIPNQKPDWPWPTTLWAVSGELSL